MLIALIRVAGQSETSNVGNVKDSTVQASGNLKTSICINTLAVTGSWMREKETFCFRRKRSVLSLFKCKGTSSVCILGRTASIKFLSVVVSSSKKICLWSLCILPSCSSPYTVPSCIASSEVDVPAYEGSISRKMAGQETSVRVGALFRIFHLAGDFLCFSLRFTTLARYFSWVCSQVKEHRSCNLQNRCSLSKYFSSSVLRSNSETSVLSRHTLREFHS